MKPKHCLVLLRWPLIRGSSTWSIGAWTPWSMEFRGSFCSVMWECVARISFIFFYEHQLRKIRANWFQISIVTIVQFFAVSLSSLTDFVVDAAKIFVFSILSCRCTLTFCSQRERFVFLSWNERKDVYMQYDVVWFKMKKTFATISGCIKEPNFRAAVQHVVKVEMRVDRGRAPIGL